MPAMSMVLWHRILGPHEDLQVRFFWYLLSDFMSVLGAVSKLWPWQQQACIEDEAFPQLPFGAFLQLLVGSWAFLLIA